MWVKYEVSIINISVIGRNVTKTEPIWLLNNEYLTYSQIICMHMWVKYEVSISNISAIGINVTKTGPIWLQNNEYMTYFPNYWHAYAQYKDVYVGKI